MRTIILLLLWNISFGQEIGFTGGPTFFLGDLGGNRGIGTRFIKDVNLSLTKAMKGIYISYPIKSWLNVRTVMDYTYVEGRDRIINTNGRDELWRKERNLDFRSSIWEIFTVLEIYPLNLEINPYAFIGVGVFHFNPQGSLNGNWYYLQPLHTEGRGLPSYPTNYTLTQMNIPMGFGFKTQINRMSISIEVLYRKTFTDYIDDVSTVYVDPIMFDRYLTPYNAYIARRISDKTVGIINIGITNYPPGTQRGNPHNLDTYFSLVLRLGVDISKRKYSQVSCPVFY